MLLGMAGFYSPNPESSWGFDLPIDLYSLRPIDEVWQRWQAHDPVQLVGHEPVRNRLCQLGKLIVECGYRDQYNLHFGARQLKQGLEEHHVPHSYREFDDNHSGLAYRFDTGLPELLSVL